MSQHRCEALRSTIRTTRNTWILQQPLGFGVLELGPSDGTRLCVKIQVEQIWVLPSSSKFGSDTDSTLRSRWLCIDRPCLPKLFDHAVSLFAELIYRNMQIRRNMEEHAHEKT